MKRRWLAALLMGLVGVTALTATPAGAIVFDDDDDLPDPPGLPLPDPDDPDAPPFPGRPNPTQVPVGDEPDDPTPDDALRLRWGRGTGDPHTIQLQRRARNGSWFTAFSTAGQAADFDIVDDGLTADTQYCYRVKATNTNGVGSSQTACANTMAAAAQPIMRAQLRLTTSLAGGAATDKGVGVTLGLGNFTHLDRVGDDFEKGDTQYYDLSLAGVSDMSDIDYLKVFSGAKDDWCLADLALLINGEVVFDQYFGHQNCRWFGSHDRGVSLVIARDTLRAHSRWQASPLLDIENIQIGYPGRTEEAVAVLSLPHDELMGRLEGAVGDAIHGIGYWRDGSAASVTPHTDSSLRVDLNLGADVNNWDDPDIDITFYLDVAAEVSDEGLIEVSLGTDYIFADVDFAWWADVLDWASLCPVVAGAVLTDDFVGCLKRLIEEPVEDGIRDAANLLSLSAEFDGGFICCSDAFAVATPEGGIDFVFELGAEPTSTPPSSGTDPVERGPGRGRSLDGGSGCDVRLVACTFGVTHAAHGRHRAPLGRHRPPNS